MVFVSAWSNLPSGPGASFERRTRAIGRPWISSGTEVASAADSTFGSRAHARQQPAGEFGGHLVCPPRDCGLADRRRRGAPPRGGIRDRCVSCRRSCGRRAPRRRAPPAPVRPEPPSARHERGCARRRRPRSQRRAAVRAGRAAALAAAQTQRRHDAEHHREYHADDVDGAVESDRDRRPATASAPRAAPRSPRSATTAPTAGADQAEHQMLGHQQAHDPPSAGAQREANAYLLPAGARPRQQQIGGVAADGEQHEQRHALEHHDRAGDETAAGRAAPARSAAPRPDATALVYGYARARSCIAALSSACAWARVTPGCSRPMAE